MSDAGWWISIAGALITAAVIFATSFGLSRARGWDSVRTLAVAYFGSLAAIAVWAVLGIAVF